MVKLIINDRFPIGGTLIKVTLYNMAEHLVSIMVRETDSVNLELVNTDMKITTLEPTSQWIGLQLCPPQRLKQLKTVA